MTNDRKSICRSTSREAAVLAWYVIYRARVIQLFGRRNIIIIIIIIIILRFPAYDELGMCRAET
jgi:hypothetical protein